MGKKRISYRCSAINITDDDLIDDELPEMDDDYDLLIDSDEYRV